MFSRKQRRGKNTGLSLDSPSSSLGSSSVARLKSPFSLSKTFSRTTTNSDDIVDDPKGPLGLNLLYSPEEPQIDLIFVHGLGGGSRKSWSKTPQRFHYWPQEWLPRDEAFRNVRIHSYGYDSDYLRGKEDCLNIHHIGKSFLGALSTLPCLAADPRTYIVAVGHSMGGLVIKKAYILASQDAAHKALVERFAAIYFLATPHRGADSANTLKNVLKVAYDRAYVADLERNSGAIQVINDEFRHFSADLELWSFYETQNMRLFSSPIVDPESAVLGYREERQVPVNADHRLICKFDTPFDANYKVIRDALASTVGKIAARAPELKMREKRDRNRDLKKYLEVSSVLDDDYLSATEARMHDSCHWIADKADYIRWKDGELGDDRTLWIKGKPATGKSVLAGYIIDHLRDSNQACSYFFFKHGDKSKSGLGRCLRSLAFQMASSSAEAGDAILELRDDGIRLDHVDERTLWRILFLSGIFQATMRRQYWVIDALDECSNPSVLDSMLSSMDQSVPLRILITSRDAIDAMDQDFLDNPPCIVRSLSMSTADTLHDLRLLIERRTQGLGVVGPEDRAPLADKILGKSKGSFLWTILVLKELVRCHSKNEINQVLEDVPRGMESLYTRTLTFMSQLARGKKLAKAILMWAVCAVRPMTTSELNGALTLDIQDTFPRLEESIAALCGHLVFVDKFGKVQMVHETAREFLLSGTPDSEFAIDRTRAHTHMARVCLAYLIGDEMKPPRNQRYSSGNILLTRIDFAAYAHTAYSYHLSKANPQETELFRLVEQFLRSNILTWIEAVACSQTLNQLIRASKHLKTYANACAAERSPLDPRIRALRQWTTDLARIPAMFANALRATPSAIYWLVPPFCPTGSMIYNASSTGRRITVLGASRENWDDRLLCIDFRRGQPSALCYGEEFLAVGLTSGPVTLYYATSHQEYKMFDHGEAVRLIAFRNKADLLATCGMKMVKIWDIRSGKVVRSFDSPPHPLDMVFDGDTLLVACRKNYVASWDIQDAQQQPLQKPWSLAPGISRAPPSRPPCALTISASHGMLAVAYTGQPITLWDMEEDAYVGSCGKKLSSGETSKHVVVALAFNPNPNIGLLVVSYLDGDLALLDPFADQQLECFRANCQTLASSPNGRLLAAGGAGGVIHVYEFDTLKLLYRVKSTNSYIKQLGFARNSLVLADIRGTQCTVWEPEALLRDSLSDESSGAATSTAGSIVETVSLTVKAKITAVLVCPTAEVILCGQEDGAVVLYSRRTATRLGLLSGHKSSVHLLKWCRRRDALLSVDASNKILLRKFLKLGFEDATVLFESRLESQKAIVDALVGDAAGKFIVSTRESDHLFSLDDGEQKMERKCPHMPDAMCKWIPHPGSDLHMICFDDSEAHIYSWEDWSEAGCFSLSLDPDSGRLLKNVTLTLPRGQEQRVMLEFSDRNGASSTTGIAMFDAACFVLANEPLREQQTDIVAAALDEVSLDKVTENIMTTSRSVAPLNPHATAFAPDIAHVIGIDELGNIVFLDRSSWVCSAALFEDGDETGQSQDSRGTIGIYRHCFIPYDWFAGRRDIFCTLAQGDIVLTRGDDLAVIRDSFEHAERVSVGRGSKTYL
ncbi:WD40-repeat-containing domain protein [Lasiosphaeria hispida]|uniref:WD40-repeat-containing domain protein n=1 Tax=Lasiosphaeria hispida TaxID=260671 RepID=A0AAJ0H9E3_9PEZI|nr:WD40-repeat-containing domain protein [Lasiosphaeria hispida]